MVYNSVLDNVVPQERPYQKKGVHSHVPGLLLLFSRQVPNKLSNNSWIFITTFCTENTLKTQITVYSILHPCKCFRDRFVTDLSHYTNRVCHVTVQQAFPVRPH